VTKYELIKALMPYTDDCEIRILIGQEPGRRREAHIDKAVWLWPEEDRNRDAHVTLVPLPWDHLTLDEEMIR
jgi:hypothetical protein